MTTIAANQETMASDSKVTVDSKGGLSYRATKIVRVKRNMIVGAAGDGGDAARFIEWAARDFKPPTPKWTCTPMDDDAIIALVLTDEGLHAFVQTDPKPEKINEPFYAIGSGGKAAAIGTRANPGPLHGISKDVWAALAVAVVYADQGGS